MATVTSVDGHQYQFDASKVIAVADHDAETGEAITCVYGILKARLHIAETVQEFLTRIGVSAQFARLTRPNGAGVWINAKSVSVVREPLPEEYVPAVHAVVAAGSLTQGVVEDAAAATAAINAHGGAL